MSRPNISLVPAPGEQLTPSAPRIVTWTPPSTHQGGTFTLSRYQAGTDLGLSDVHLDEEILAAAPQTVTFSVPASGALFGSLTLVYSNASYLYPHLYTIGVGGPWEAFSTAVHLSFATSWDAAGKFPHKGAFIAAPPVVPRNAGNYPSQEPYVEVEVLADGRAESWGCGKVKEIAGLMQVDLHVPAGDGTALLARMTDRVELTWEAVEVSGLHTYTTGMPQDLPKPPPGYFAQHVDTPFTVLSE